MKHPLTCGERLEAFDTTNAGIAALMFAASAGMIWDLATGHVSAFERMLSDLSDDDRPELPQF